MDIPLNHRRFTVVLRQHSLQPVVAFRDEFEACQYIFKHEHEELLAGAATTDSAWQREAHVHIVFSVHWAPFSGKYLVVHLATFDLQKAQRWQERVHLDADETTWPGVWGALRSVPIACLPT